jgi:hypothetical protein
MKEQTEGRLGFRLGQVRLGWVRLGYKFERMSF